MLHSLLHCVSRQVRLTTIYSPHHSSQMISQLNKTNQHKLLQEHHKTRFHFFILNRKYLRCEQDHPAPSAHPALTPQCRGHCWALRRVRGASGGSVSTGNRDTGVRGLCCSAPLRERETAVTSSSPIYHPANRPEPELLIHYHTITDREREREILGLPK